MSSTGFSFSSETIQALQVAIEENHSISNLEQLGINQKLINLLESHGILSINKLLSTKRDQLLKINNFGPKQLNLLLGALSKYKDIDEN